MEKIDQKYHDINWLEKVNKDFDKYIVEWISAFRRGELQKEDILEVVKKVADLRGNNDLVEEVKQRLV